MNKIDLALGIMLAGLVFLLFAVGCTDANTPGYQATVADTRGKCWTLITKPDAEGKQIRIAVSPEDGKKLGLVKDKEVSFRGVPYDRDLQDCGNAVKIKVQFE